MAFAHVGSIGSNVSTTSGTTVAASVAADAPAGNLLLVTTVWDNTDTVVGETTRLSCADTKGNIYTKVAEYTNAHGAAEDGVTVALFYTVVTTALLVIVPDTVTVTSTTARVAKVVALRLFTTSSPIVSIMSYSFDVGDAVDPASMTLTGLSLREYLFWHSVGSEGPSTDTFTLTASYTSGGGIGTNVGGADANVSSRPEFRILTGTDDSVDITNTTTTRDYAQFFVAFYENPVTRSFYPQRGFGPF